MRTPLVFCLKIVALPSPLTMAAAVIALAAALPAGLALASGPAAKPLPAASSQTAHRPGEDLQAQVQRLIGRAACDSDAQCRTLPLGQRACGGPEAFVAWSVLATDLGALRLAAERYTQWQAQQQARSGAMSICMVETDPGAVCAKAASSAAPGVGRCVLGKHERGSVAR